MTDSFLNELPEICTHMAYQQTRRFWALHAST